MKIFVQNLVLELTRQCNLSCAHCMRGESENKKISDEVIENIFGKISDIGSLQFSGGESALAIDRINKVADELKKNKNVIRNATIYTNATLVNDKYLDALSKLKAVISNARATLGMDSSSYKGLCKKMDIEERPLKMIVSLDKYHLNSIDEMGLDRLLIKKNIDKLCKCFPVEIDKICNYIIFNEGRAKNLTNVYKLNGQSAWAIKQSKEVMLIGPVLNFSYNGQAFDHLKPYKDCKKGLNVCNSEIFTICKELKPLKLCLSEKGFYRAVNNIAHRSNTTTKNVRNAVKFYGGEVDLSYLNEEIPDYKQLEKSE